MVLIALTSAIGWGAGGMISYGQVVGYGKADNFIYAFYKLGTLFVIGALFGLLGGGLVGLVLEATKKDALFFLFVYLGRYALASYLVTGLFAGKTNLNHHLYLLNILVIDIIVHNEKTEYVNAGSSPLPAKKGSCAFLPSSF